MSVARCLFRNVSEMDETRLEEEKDEGKCNGWETKRGWVHQRKCQSRRAKELVSQRHNCPYCPLNTEKNSEA